MQAIRDKVLVEIEQDDSSSFVTTGMRVRSAFGTVRSIGELVTEVSVGDRVYFSPVIGNEISVNGKKYVSLPISTIDGRC